MSFMDKFEIELQDNTEQHTGYYCNVCDAVAVSPDKPESGKFFKVYGTCMDPWVDYVDGRNDGHEITDREDDGFVGVYVPVKFAICAHCLSK